jgi:hypothetical protein
MAKMLCPNSDTNTKSLYLCPIFLSLRVQTQTQMGFFGETLGVCAQTQLAKMGPHVSYVPLQRDDTIPVQVHGTTVASS